MPESFHIVTKAHENYNPYGKNKPIRLKFSTELAACWGIETLDKNTTAINLTRDISFTSMFKFDCLFRHRQENTYPVTNLLVQPDKACQCIWTIHMNTNLLTENLYSSKSCHQRLHRKVITLSEFAQ